MLRKAITPYGPSKAAMEAATIAWAEAMFGTGVRDAARQGVGGANPVAIRSMREDFSSAFKPLTDIREEAQNSRS